MEFWQLHHQDQPTPDRSQFYWWFLQINHQYVNCWCSLGTCSSISCAEQCYSTGRNESVYRTVEKLHKVSSKSKMLLLYTFFLSFAHWMERQACVKTRPKCTAELWFNISADAMNNIKSFTFLWRRWAQSRWSSRITAGQSRSTDTSQV